MKRCIFGEIAASNSLSSLYVQGCKPLFVLGIVGFPSLIPLGVLGEILQTKSNAASIGVGS